MLLDIFTYAQEGILPAALRIIGHLWPIWAPLAVLGIGLTEWFKYKRRHWIKDQNMLLLEIKFPNEMVKSPLAMEIVLQTLHQPGVGSLSDVFFKGRIRMWSSLELVSNGGKVHFYMWVNAKIRNVVEAALYAQFPNIEIHEVPDYTTGLTHDEEKYKFGKLAHLVLTKPDAYPIRTYIDYGLDKDPDEEYKNDPIASVIEYLGSLKPGEHAWIQILLQAHVKETFKYGRFFVKPDWKGAANDEIKKIAKEAKFKTPEDKGGDSKFLTETQKETVKAIERSIEKTAFDTMIRVAYFAEKDVYNANNIGGILGVLKQFSSNTLNGFKPSQYEFDYPWQDFLDIRKKRKERKFLEAYKRRSIFNQPFYHLHDDKPYILTTEELATLFHFPSSMVAATPTLSRIPSKKAEAPANLPV